MAITIVSLNQSLEPTIRGSREVPGGGGDLYIKIADVINALRAVGCSTAADYLDEAWKATEV